MAKPVTGLAISAHFFCSLKPLPMLISTLQCLSAPVFPSWICLGKSAGDTTRCPHSWLDWDNLNGFKYSHLQRLQGCTCRGHQLWACSGVSELSGNSLMHANILAVAWFSLACSSCSFWCLALSAYAGGCKVGSSSCLWVRKRTSPCGYIFTIILHMVFMCSNLPKTNQRLSLFPARGHRGSSQYAVFRYFMDVQLPRQCVKTAADSHLPDSFKSWLK